MVVVTDTTVDIYIGDVSFLSAEAAVRCFVHFLIAENKTMLE